MTDPGEGFASQVSGNVRPLDPGGGAVSIVPPRRMTSDDVSVVKTYPSIDPIAAPPPPPI